jgi:hypothetical protein
MHFRHFWHSKKRFGRSGGSDDLSRRIALKPIVCHLDVKKNDFVEVGEAIFQGVEFPCELIVCFLGIEKSDLEKFA